MWVLDPFAGVETTLLESYIQAFKVLGFEINPYAAFASGTKLQAGEVSPHALRAKIAGFTSLMERH